MTNPRGEKHAAKSGSTSFSNTFYQGIYELNRGGDRQLLAINYQSASESDLRDGKSIELKPTEGVNSGSTLFSFWPYLLMASLLLFIVEWFFVPPAAPRQLPAAPRTKLS